MPINTNDLSPDQPTALFITQAVASTLASFGQNELETASQSLNLAAESVALIRDRALREKLFLLVQAAGKAMLAIDVEHIARAAAR